MLKLNSSPLSFPPEKATNLNTSYVKVKHGKNMETPNDSVFKYILC